MTREEILVAIKPYFEIKELVCNHTFDKYGEASWDFLDTNYLWALLVIRRDILKRPMVCNDKDSKQRGLRCNRCPIVREKPSVYLSMHIFGKAGDFTVIGMTAEAARKKIKENAHLLPCKVRLEKDVTWLHIDVKDMASTNQMVYEFKA